MQEGLPSSLANPANSNNLTQESSAWVDSKESFPTVENAFVYSMLLVIVLMKSIMVLKEIGPRWQQDRVAA